MSNPNSSISAHGLDALHRLKSIDPVLLLSPSPEISATARSASQHLFSSLLPFCPKSPFDRLLVDGFDAEQIWQQIDLQSQPLISNIRQKLRRLEQNPGEISKVFDGLKKKSLGGSNDYEGEDLGLEKNRRKEVFLKEDEEDGEFSAESEGFEEEDEGEEEEEEEEEGDEEEEKEVSGSGGIEDRFLKIKELEEYLERNEKEEYEKEDDDDDEDEDEDEDEDDDEDEEDEMAGDGDGDEEIDNMGSVRYDDFFSGKKKKTLKKRVDSSDESEGLALDEEQEGDENLSEQNNGILSTHEKQLEKIRSDIEQMEKANLEPKSWTMQGEVTAAKRPKNSALEVDLDFEHNVRPAPVITEEVTASLEELIKKRILEGHFDDVQKAISLPSKPPKELKELDENKSKKGLAEIYEEEYVQKTSVASAPLTFTDEQKKEATVLFKRLCLKLDALSHFHFAPKPVIEDMSIQPNVPALAMEEIAPLAVSDAAMLAPEEVFTGKGDIKEETELSQAERKRRRANKKRKFKAKTVKRDAAQKARDNTVLNKSNAAKDS